MQTCLQKLDQKENNIQYIRSYLPGSLVSETCDKLSLHYEKKSRKLRPIQRNLE